MKRVPITAINRRRLILALLFIDIFLMSTYKLGDYDIWYHLSAGRYIVQTGSVNHLDPFSYTAADRPWSVQSWLAGVIFYAVHAAGGVAGLILFNSLVITAAFFLVYRTMRLFVKHEDDFPVLGMVLLLAAFTARFRFMVRPHAFEFLFLAATLYVLELYRSRGKNRLWLLPLIQLLWVNIHGSHILGLVLPLIYLLGGWLQGLLPGAGRPRPVPMSRLAASLTTILAANILATTVNPHTYKAFSLPFLITGQETYMRHIGEWQPFTWHVLWGYGLRFTWGFVVLCLLYLVSLLIREREVDYTGLLLFCFFLASVFKGTRLMAEFGLAVSVPTFRNLSGLLAPVARSGGRAVQAVLVLLLVAVIPPVLIFSPSYAFGYGIKEYKFPEKAVRFIEENNLSGNMFNSFPFGDYLSWRVFPKRKVFIHGRNEVFPQELFEEYLQAHRSPAVWKKATEKYNITWALLQYHYLDYTGSKQIAHLRTDPDWVPVYWDMTAVVYVRNVPENREVIEKWGYRYLRPAFFSFKYLYPYLAQGLAGPLLAEADRLVAQSPGNEEAYLVRATIHFQLGRAYNDRAMADVKAAIGINPKRALSHSALGTLYQEQQDFKAAIAEYREAFRLDPRDATALAGIKSLKARK